MPGRVSLTDAHVRHWLLNFYRFEPFTDPVVRDLLRAHGRPHTGSPLAVSEELRRLIQEKIAGFTPAPGAPPEAWRPYQVLQSYMHRDKLRVVAWRLHVSERQASRERARAVSLLRAELESPS